MFDQILSTVASEFSDVPDAAHLARIVVRLLVAALLGALLGYERERRGKAAGMRTHMLVALGCALFVLVPEQNGMDSSGLARVIQGVATGVGFLGAGAIIKQQDEVDVHGLTTAAGIWATAAIGIACGLGRETTAVVSAVLAFVVLAFVPHMPSRGGKDEDSRDE